MVYEFQDVGVEFEYTINFEYGRFIPDPVVEDPEPEPEPEEKEESLEYLQLKQVVNGLDRSFAFDVDDCDEWKRRFIYVPADTSFGLLFNSNIIDLALSQVSYTDAFDQVV